MRGSAKTLPRRIVLDAGPLIALFHGQDPDHADAERGLTALVDHHVEMISPAPVVFEVYKWLLYHADHAMAQIGLQEMRIALAITYVDAEEFDLACEVTRSLQNWTGTLEDAVVAFTALRLRAPVWTLNHRDLSAFPRLLFWSP